MEKENQIKFTGRVIYIGQSNTYVDKNGNNNTKMGFAIKTDETYPKTVYFEVFGADKIEKFDIHKNDVVEASVNISSREYMGKWFTSIVAWRVVKIGKIEESQHYSPEPNEAPKAPQTADDLPF